MTGQNQVVACDEWLLVRESQGWHPQGWQEIQAPVLEWRLAWAAFFVFAGTVGQ